MVQVILAARGRITTHFREDIGRGFLHNGIDQGHGDSTPEDLEIRAPADGLIVSAGKQGSYGNRYIIRHDDGWTSILAHHAKQFCEPGQRVKQRELIAEMGNTGTVFVHSHQELLNERNQQVDPLLHLTSTAGNGTTPLEDDDMFSDADRALLTQAAKPINLPVLVKLKGKPEVWLSNLVTRRHVASEAEQAKVQNSLAGRGIDATVNIVPDLTAFGVIVK